MSQVSQKQQGLIPYNLYKPQIFQDLTISGTTQKPQRISPIWQFPSQQNFQL